MAKKAPATALALRDGPAPARTALDIATDTLQPAIIWAVALGFCITMLAFVGPLYVMNIYERVLGSRNETTLTMLTLVVVFALLILAVLEASRADMMRRASVAFDRKLAGPAFDAIQRACARRPLDASIPSLRDVEGLREFVASPLLTQLLDLLWFPLFLLACLILHPVFALLALVAALLVAGLSVLTTCRIDGPLREAGKAEQSAARRASAAFRNVEAVQAMGMGPATRRTWQAAHEAALGWLVVADDRSTTMRTLANFARALSQTVTLALAAYLVLHDELTPAQIFAVSIIVGRAMQPLQQVAGQWTTLANARETYRRLQALLREAAPGNVRMSLPHPAGRLSAQGLVVSAPGHGVDLIILRAVSFELPAGAVLAITGASASGKSSLLRVMLNIWTPLAGEFRLDGADIRHWNAQALSHHVGYLPQTVELFPGTVAQNIAHFSETVMRL